jgi:hypothetical protein
MTILSELAVRIGFVTTGEGAARAKVQGIARDVEQANKSARSAAGGFNVLQTAAKAFLGLQVVGFVRNFTGATLELGSAVEENKNVLEQAFGADGVGQVESWAKSVGEEVGRSQYTLAQFAGKLGALLQPMVGNREEALKMSEAYSKLAVDLASFYNTSDEDALNAIKSGIAGETEPLRRYGVLLQDATLKEFARKEGITKSLQAMNQAEKAQLRFNYIMSQTSNAQGDAARTAGGYANQLKRFEEGAKELRTALGLALLPAFTSLLQVGNKVVVWLVEMQNKTKFLQTLVVTGLVVAFVKLAGAIGTAAKAGTLFGNVLSAGKFLAVVAVWAAFALILEDIQKALTGGKSLIGLWVDDKFGLGAVDKLVQNIAAGFKIISENGVFKALSEGFLGARDIGASEEAERLAASENPNERKLGLASIEGLKKEGRYRSAVERGSPDRAVAVGRGLTADAASAEYGRARGSIFGDGGSNSQSVTVVVNPSPGMDEKKIGKVAAEEVKKALDKTSRNVRAALTDQYAVDGGAVL